MILGFSAPRRAGAIAAGVLLILGASGEAWAFGGGHGGGHLGGGHLGGGHGLGGGLGQPAATPMVVAPPAPDTPPETAALLADLFSRLQKQDDRALTVEGRLAETQDRITNLIGLLIGIGLAQALLFALILFVSLRTAKASATAAAALPILERAYVFAASETRLERPASLGASPAVKARVGLVLANHGRTPAVVRWVNVAAQYLLEPPEGEYAEHERQGAGMVLAPGRAEPFDSLEVTIVRADWDRAAAGQGEVYLHGRIVYADIFGAQHETRFCWRYDIAAGAFRVVGSETLNRRD